MTKYAGEYYSAYNIYSTKKERQISCAKIWIICIKLHFCLNTCQMQWNFKLQMTTSDPPPFLAMPELFQTCTGDWSVSLFWLGNFSIRSFYCYNLYLCHALPAPSAGVHSLQRPCGANSHHQIQDTSLTIRTVCHPKLTITWSSMWLCVLASDRMCSTNTM